MHGEAEALKVHGTCTFRALSFPNGKGPNLIVDDGGDATLLIHKGFQLENGDTWPTLPARAVKKRSLNNC